MAYPTETTARPAPQPIQPVNPSCFGTLEQATANAQSAAQRVEHFVERLCGSQPEQGSTSKPDVRGLPNGLLDEASQYATQIHNFNARIMAALDRLEKNLP